MKCTLKVNMIFENGQHHARGSVLDRELIPAHLRKPDYIADGVVGMELTTPVEVIELEDLELEDKDKQLSGESPMRELTLDQLPSLEEQLGPQPEPRKPLVAKRKLVPKKR
jgi:hypothetical protein